MEALSGEILNINNEYGSYQEYKASLDADFQEAAERFVVIGYKLKVARDTDILKESGYGNVNEFAEAEYGLDKSQTSRFMNINDEFSENGYSKRLREEYRRFGVAKLAVMLTLPAAVNEELTADYTKSEIRMVKEEIDEEKMHTDIEVMLEEKDMRQQEYTLFGRILYQIGRDRPELYLRLYDAVENTVYDGSKMPVVNKLADALAPAGEGIVSVRIPGEGKMLLSIKGPGADPAVVNIRTGEKTACTWDDFIIDMEALCEAPDAKESWKLLYGEEFPEAEKEDVPAQPGRDAKQAQKKPQRVTVSKPAGQQKPKETGEDNRLTTGMHTGYKEVNTECQKEEEQGRNEQTAVAPVQPENTGDGTGNVQHDTAVDQPDAGRMHDMADTGSRIPAQEDSAGRVPAGINQDDAESLYAAPGTGDGDGGAAAVMGHDADHVEAPPAAVLTEKIPGQMVIGNYPECMPDNTAAGQKQAAAAGYLAALKDNLDKVYILAERGEYRKAEEWLEAVRGTIRKVEEVSEVHGNTGTQED